MKVLVACEFSGIVRESFKVKGHDAWSCDLLETEIPGNHIQGDVTEVLKSGWDLCIAHPPCTYLTVSGNRWFYHPDDSALPIHLRRAHPRYPNRRDDQLKAVEFFMLFARADIPRIAIENPIGVMSTKWRKPNQIIQPWEFGHGEVKATCLWLKGLPNLVPTNIVPERNAVIHGMSQSKKRSKERSRTYQGIADAMASQWGDK